MDDERRTVTQHLLGALSKENVGAVLMREMDVQGDTLVIRLETTAADGATITRTLTWQRVGQNARIEWCRVNPRCSANSATVGRFAARDGKFIDLDHHDYP